MGIDHIDEIPSMGDESLAILQKILRDNAEQTEGVLFMDTVPTAGDIPDGKKVIYDNGEGTKCIYWKSAQGNVVSLCENAGGAPVFNRVEIDTTDSPYTQLPLDYYIACDVSAGTVAIVLQEADVAGNGKELRVKDVVGNAASNNITVSASGGHTIDGAASRSLILDFQALIFISDGVSNWEVH